MSLNPSIVKSAITDPSLQLYCSTLHESCSCNGKFLQQFTNTSKGMWKIYLIVHMIPLIVFKRKKLRNSFLKTMAKFVEGYVKSMLFAGLYLAIVRRSICFLTGLQGYQGWHALPTGFLGGISLIFESPSRQCEIALYCLNKSIETAYTWMKRRNYFHGIPKGEVLLFGVTMAILCYFYQNEQDSMKTSNLAAMKKLIGDV